jgi:dihydrolipoamide dehydrogenase
MVIIGGGVIGLELGSVYSRLGSKVSVIEYTNSIIPTMDAALGKELQRVLRKQGFEFFFSHKVKSAINTGSEVEVKADNEKGEEVDFKADYCLVSVGRKPYTQGLGLENAGVKVDERGRIETNDHLETNIAGIYAIGDVVVGAMLAHKAEEEGVAVAERIAGQHGHVNFNTIPWVIYTSPEIAWVGKTEQQLKAEGIAYKAGTFPFMANGRARALGDTSGMVKFLADAKTDEILGVHIIGPMASELIAEAVVAMEFRASAEDIARICHAHPSLSEATKEAALAVDKRALNF